MGIPTSKISNATPQYLRAILRHVATKEELKGKRISGMNKTDLYGELEGYSGRIQQRLGCPLISHLREVWPIGAQVTTLPYVAKEHSLSEMLMRMDSDDRAHLEAGKSVKGIFETLFIGKTNSGKHKYLRYTSCRLSEAGLTITCESDHYRFVKSEAGYEERLEIRDHQIQIREFDQQLFLLAHTAQKTWAERIIEPISGLLARECKVEPFNMTSASVQQKFRGHGFLRLVAEDPEGKQDKVAFDSKEGEDLCGKKDPRVEKAEEKDSFHRHHSVTVTHQPIDFQEKAEVQIDFFADWITIRFPNKISQVAIDAILNSLLA